MSKEDDKRLSYKNTRFVELKKYWIRWLVKWRPNLFNEDRKVYVEFIYVCLIVIQDSIPAILDKCKS